MWASNASQLPHPGRGEGSSARKECSEEVQPRSSGIVGPCLVLGQREPQQALGCRLERLAVPCPLLKCPHKIPPYGSVRHQGVVVGLPNQLRSEERLVGNECVRTCRSLWSQYH